MSWIDNNLTGNCYVITSTDNVSNLSRKLIMVVDVLGRKTNQKKNTPLFYIFDDGTVEKKIKID